MMQRVVVTGAVVALTWLGAGCGSVSPEVDAGCDTGSVCKDSDCDTICDIEEGYPDQDTDGDGEPDYLDTDSDNDGISDREEAGDGDPATPPADRNMNGTPDVYEEDYPLRAWRPGGPSEDGGTVPDPPDPVMDASMGIDGGGSYTMDSGEVNAERCPASAQVPSACVSEEQNLCDGLDNDCDGTVDGTAVCGCKRGEVRSCFTGPPGRRGVGACADGQQVCIGSEFTFWGPCEGGNAPSQEICDGIDNDCNGCTDELTACDNGLKCPEPGDPRIITGRPFQEYTLSAHDFYTGGDASAYRWRIEGSPCDRLFGAIDMDATSESGALSYRLSQARQAEAKVRFELSGSYNVSLDITTPEGVIGCSWIMPVHAPGVRVELCWPNTGPVTLGTGDQVDLDLHLARENRTSTWGGNSDCFHQTCAGATSPWGFTHSALDACQGSRNTAVYEVLGHCPNPRLDADNRLDAASRRAYITENINLDNPGDGDRLRVMVAHNDNAANEAQGHPNPPVSQATEPLVNIYCGGTLKATYGGNPALLVDDPDAVTGLETPGQRWKVADILIDGGGAQTDCTVNPLAAPAPAMGYWIDDGTPAAIAW